MDPKTSKLPAYRPDTASHDLELTDKFDLSSPEHIVSESITVDRPPVHTSITAQSDPMIAEVFTPNAGDHAGAPHKTMRALGDHPRPYPILGLGSAILGLGLTFGVSAQLGADTASYKILWGGGGPHLMSQLCTVALFSWGVGELLRSILHLRLERRATSSLARSLALNITSGPLPEVQATHQLTLGFWREIARGLGLRTSADAQVSYLEARDLVSAAREQTLDELTTYERGAQAAMWLIPLSGFLGTVLGMSETIAEFDALFQPTDASKPLGLLELAPAIQGLSTAFDTTMLALALVIPLKLKLVYTQRLGERFSRELERGVGERALEFWQSQRALKPARVESGSEVATLLGELSAQSQTLNDHIAETARALADLRGQVGRHPALSDRAQRRLHDALVDAVREGLGSASSGANSSEITQTLNALNEQLGELRESLDAPLTIQRIPRPARSSERAPTPALHINQKVKLHER